MAMKLPLLQALDSEFSAVWVDSWPLLTMALPSMMWPLAPVVVTWRSRAVTTAFGLLTYALEMPSKRLICFVPVYVLDRHTEAVSAIAFSNDGTYLYSGDESGELLTWKIER